jgi:hypothetical protein
MRGFHVAMTIFLPILLLGFLIIPCSNAIDFRRWKKIAAQNSNQVVGRDLQDFDECQVAKYAFEALSSSSSSSSGGGRGSTNNNGDGRMAAICACHETTKGFEEDDAGYASRLTCTATTHYCDEEEDGYKYQYSHPRITASFEATLTDGGAITAYREILSRNNNNNNDEGKDGEEDFIIDYFGCDGVDNCEECRVSVDGSECSSCVLNDCGDGFSLPTFSCENIESESNFDLCEEESSSSFQQVPRGSRFEFLAVSSSGETTKPCTTIHRALQVNDVPSQMPSPFPTFFEDNRCPLRIGTSKCAALVVATQLTPIGGCDCYNFCNGEYVGCTGLRETGSVECDTDFVPVAGCRLDGIVDEGDEVGCTADLQNGTTVFIPEGESYGDLVTVTQCQPSSDFPCFCRSLTEDDSIRCPYCLFTEMGGGSICARDNENVTFVDMNGLTQRCNCNYIGNGLSARQCQEVVEPTLTCILRSNTEQCATVTEFVSPKEDCDCYNFCEGKKKCASWLFSPFFVSPQHAY